MPALKREKLYAIGAVAIGFAVLVALRSRAERQSFVLFDTNGVDLEARIDGKAIGSAKGPIARPIEPGRRTLELVDGKGHVEASATVDVPPKWRGVLSSVAKARYTVVTLTYDEKSKPAFRPVPQAAPGLFVLEGETGLWPEEMEEIGKPFESTGAKGTSTVRLCRLDADGRPDCLQ